MLCFKTKGMKISYKNGHLEAEFPALKVFRGVMKFEGIIESER
ncbi:hypothetical protein D515_02404 [Grimontia indica]|uniref:Uncharacterized protein n=1 Tax=Grimontia indica TaxID=1056512 RepID=R1IN73_9GAMM|nr:hypothetical protein D515_02404 [Grimontia indica]